MDTLKVKMKDLVQLDSNNNNATVSLNGNGLNGGLLSNGNGSVVAAAAAGISNGYSRKSVNRCSDCDKGELRGRGYAGLRVPWEL